MINIICPMNSIQQKCKGKMNKIFKKSRSVSPSIEVPKICLPRQAECVDDGYDLELSKSLNVPNENRIRSSSFDSSSLQRQNTYNKELLEVPGKTNRRCHSFDSAFQISPSTSEENINDSRSSGGSGGSLNFVLKVPKYQGRRPSYDIPKLCIHCIHMEAKAQENMEREQALMIYNRDMKTTVDECDDISFTSSTSYSSSTIDSLSDPSGFYYLSDSDDEGNESDCEDNLDSPSCKNTLNSESFDSYQGNVTSLDSQSPSPEKRSILDFLNGHNIPHIDSKDEEDFDDIIDDVIDPDDDDDEDDDEEDFINAVTLTVPNIKQVRSSSMDACFVQSTETNKTTHKQVVQRQKSFDQGDMLNVPIQIRSSSVDVNLPTEQESRYKAIPNSDSR